MWSIEPRRKWTQPEFCPFHISEYVGVVGKPEPAWYDIDSPRRLIAFARFLRPSATPPSARSPMRATGLVLGESRCVVVASSGRFGRFLWGRVDAATAGSEPTAAVAVLDV
jgi:hypothetical protein